MHRSELVSFAFSLNLSEINLHIVPSAPTQTPFFSTLHVRYGRSYDSFLLVLYKKIQMDRNLQFRGEWDATAKKKKQNYDCGSVLAIIMWLTQG